MIKNKKFITVLLILISLNVIINLSCMAATNKIPSKEEIRGGGILNGQPLDGISIYDIKLEDYKPKPNTMYEYYIYPNDSILFENTLSIKDGLIPYISLEYNSEDIIACLYDKTMEEDEVKEISNFYGAYYEVNELYDSLNTNKASITGYGLGKDIFINNGKDKITTNVFFRTDNPEYSKIKIYQDDGIYTYMPLKLCNVETQMGIFANCITVYECYNDGRQFMYYYAPHVGLVAVEQYTEGEISEFQKLIGIWETE